MVEEKIAFIKTYLQNLSSEMDGSWGRSIALDTNERIAIIMQQRLLNILYHKEDEKWGKFVKTYRYGNGPYEDNQKTANNPFKKYDFDYNIIKREYIAFCIKH